MKEGRNMEKQHILFFRSYIGLSLIPFGFHHVKAPSLPSETQKYNTELTINAARFEAQYLRLPFSSNCRLLLFLCAFFTFQAGGQWQQKITLMLFQLLLQVAP